MNLLIIVVRFGAMCRLVGNQECTLVGLYKYPGYRQENVDMEVQGFDIYDMCMSRHVNSGNTRALVIVLLIGFLGK